MNRTVVTWFYIQDAKEGGTYAQNRGDSSTEAFRDVYRRCLGVFFASARRANPEANLVLYLNHPWQDASPTARAVRRLLDGINVVRRIIPYRYAPPATWHQTWRNQFFLFDVLEDLAGSLPSRSLVTVLDSDIVWTGPEQAFTFWTALDAAGAMAYPLPYAHDESINGLTRNELTALTDRLLGGSRSRQQVIDYYGGEFVAFRHDMLLRIVDEVAGAWAQTMVDHANGQPTFGEEAHMLSSLYEVAGVKPVDATSQVRRLWTQVGHYRNTRPSDVQLTLWHVPAEKRYGLRRMWRDVSSVGFEAWSTRSDWQRYAARRLGIPSNSGSKAILDIGVAVRERARRRVSG